MALARSSKLRSSGPLICEKVPQVEQKLSYPNHEQNLPRNITDCTKCLYKGNGDAVNRHIVRRISHFFDPISFSHTAIIAHQLHRAPSQLSALTRAAYVPCCLEPASVAIST
jgi:hypothetical protein